MTNNTAQQQNAHTDHLKRRLISVKIGECDLIRLFKDNSELQNFKDVLYFSTGKGRVLNPIKKRCKGVKLKS
jgi:hypothetical protein